MKAGDLVWYQGRLYKLQKINYYTFKAELIVSNRFITVSINDLRLA